MKSYNKIVCVSAIHFFLVLKRIVIEQNRDTGLVSAAAKRCNTNGIKVRFSKIEKLKKKQNGVD